eukprot:TRINITY_DN2742_c0_g1_i3.p1 TRINITY_DN2742_c0_g1~~TRINITY_DN2742_c0_g1_i3.p1  ORF type:complete len:469 (-),score=90.67 TRINITY_DN2742_c0_g1_i3:111-1409(-)
MCIRDRVSTQSTWGNKKKKNTLVQKMNVQTLPNNQRQATTLSYEKCPKCQNNYATASMQLHLKFCKGPERRINNNNANTEEPKRHLFPLESLGLGFLKRANENHIPPEVQGLVYQKDAANVNKQYPQVIKIQNQRHEPRYNPQGFILTDIMTKYVNNNPFEKIEIDDESRARRRQIFEEQKGNNNNSQPPQVNQKANETRKEILQRLPVDIPLLRAQYNAIAGLGDINPPRMLPVAPATNNNNDNNSGVRIPCEECGNQVPFDDYERHMREHENRPQNNNNRKGLTPEQIASIPDIKFKPTEAKNWSEEHTKCSICYEDYVEQTDLKMLPCLHRFHTQCISEWLKDHNQCPLCKNKVLGNDNQAKLLRFGPCSLMQGKESERDRVERDALTVCRFICSAVNRQFNRLFILFFHFDACIIYALFSPPIKLLRN